MHSRRGLSLIVVLSFMLAATLAATALSVLISRYSQRSALRLYGESAVAAAHAGQASVKSWLGYEGEEVLNVLENYLDTCATGCRPFKLGLGGDYLAEANRHHQSFEAYIVDVAVDSSTTNAPVTVKIQIQATGQDESQSVLTSIYTLKGLSFQRGTPYTISSGTVQVPDALYIKGGMFQDVRKPLVIDGSAYVQSTFRTISGGKVHVKGDLVFGKDFEAYVNDSLVVDGNLYVTGDFRLESGGRVWVKENAVFRTHLKYLSGSLRTEGDAYFGDTVGSGGLKFSTNGIDDSLSIGGNASFMNSVQIMGNGKLRVQGDAGFMNPGAYLRAGAGARMRVHGNALIYPTVCWQDVGTGYFSGTFVHTLLRGDDCYGFTSTDPSLAPATVWDGWQGTPTSWSTPKTITAATRLPEIADSLENGGTEKTVPFTLKASHFIAIADSLQTRWSVLFPNPQTATDWRATCDGLDAAEGVYTPNTVRTTVLQCLGENMPASLRYHGIPVLDLRNTYWSSLNAATEKLTGTYALLVNQDPITLPPTSANGRLLVYYTGSSNPVIQVLGADTCNCAIYSEKGLKFGLGVFNGAVVVNNTTGTTDASQTTDDEGTRVLKHDPSILDDLAGSNLLLDASGNPLGTSTTVVYSPAMLSLLSPRLTVDLQGEQWGGDRVDVSSAVSYGRTLNVVPKMLIAKAKAYASWSDFVAERDVKGYVQPLAMREGCSEPAPLSTSGVDFATPGTYTVTYFSTCESGRPPTGNLIVWIQPTQALAQSASGSSATAASSSLPASSSSYASPASSSSAGTETGAMSYLFKMAGTCPGTGNTLQFGVRIGNQTGHIVNLKNYRVSYFMNDAYAAASWARQNGSPWNGSYQDNVKNIHVSFADIGAGGSSPRLYNRLIQVTWAEDTYVISGSEGGFDDLSLIHGDWSGSIASLDDYSYDGCTTEYSVNDYVVFESNQTGSWQVVSGTMPTYASVASSSSEAASSSGTSTNCTCPSGCSSLTSITLPYSINGQFDKCVFSGTKPSNVNMYNSTTATINGTSYNGWSATFPATVDGGYYMYLRSTSDYGHFEAN